LNATSEQGEEHFVHFFLVPENVSAMVAFCWIMIHQETLENLEACVDHGHREAIVERKATLLVERLIG
jgi:hypothetical protein